MHITHVCLNCVHVGFCKGSLGWKYGLLTVCLCWLRITNCILQGLILIFGCMGCHIGAKWGRPGSTGCFGCPSWAVLGKAMQWGRGDVCVLVQCVCVKCLFTYMLQLDAWTYIHVVSNACTFLYLCTNTVTFLFISNACTHICWYIKIML